MAYTKVSTITVNGNWNDGTSGNPVAWKYFIETFLPTVGWTVTLTDSNSANPPASLNDWHYYFLKKTLTFTDGTTDTISFVLVVEGNQTDIHYHSWDGVKATNDTSDPDFNRGTNNKADDTSSVIVSGAGTFDIWKDADSDSWVWLKDGRFVGCWFPDGGWVRQDFKHAASDQAVSNQAHMFPAWDTSTIMCSVNNGWGALQTSLPIDEPNKNKLTNYISLNCNNYGLWLGTSNNMLMNASRSTCQPENGSKGELLQVGSSAPYDYYYGMIDVNSDRCIYFNFGTTDPGY